MADTKAQVTGEELEKEVEKLLAQEKFAPPEDFKENALWNDPSIYEEANKDWRASWARHAEDLHWFDKSDEVLDDSNPPFYKWYTGGPTHPSYTYTAPHLPPGTGDRVAFAPRGAADQARH